MAYDECKDVTIGTTKKSSSHCVGRTEHDGSPTWDSHVGQENRARGLAD